MAVKFSPSLSDHSKYSLLSPSPTHHGIFNFTNPIHTTSNISIFSNSRISCVSPSSSSSTPVVEDEKSIKSIGLEEVKGLCKKWVWKGYTINYLMCPSTTNHTASPPALLLVHGFGASVAHWRRNIPTLAQDYTVYAVDLLGFGASDKPIGFEYSMEVWAQLILDFLEEIVQKPSVLIGNSVGSLACLISTSDANQSLIQGIVLLNCAGGMNNKAVVDDWRIKLLLPLFWLIDFLLNQKGIATFIFERVRQKENIRNILQSIYGNKESVDDELVEIIRTPAYEEGALDAFVSIVTGPPGPNPVQLIPNLSLPVLVLWGDTDNFTPLDGPVGKYFSSLPAQRSNITISILEGTGHCPHDDRPELVHEKLLPWLADLRVT